MSVMEDDIYHYQDKPKIDTRQLFKFTVEERSIRVSNKAVDCLYVGQLTESEFDHHYNEIHRFFNPRLEALAGSKLSLEDFEIIEQDLITSWIRFYVLYGMPVKVRRDDFIHNSTVDTVQAHLLKKGLTREEAIDIGSSLMRMSRREYVEIMDYLDWYHSMK